MSNPTFIAEIKPLSPFSGPSKHPVELLTEVAVENGDWVAAHTDPRWGGSVEHLAKVRDQMKAQGVSKPLLAKGIHADDFELLEILDIADFALVVNRVPDFHDLSRLIYEPSSLSGGVRVAEARFMDKMMWNARDLSTGQPVRDPYTIREVKIACDGNWDWVCQASFIRTPDDIQPWADAFIVGTHLTEYVDAITVGYVNRGDIEAAVGDLLIPALEALSRSEARLRASANVSVNLIRNTLDDPTEGLSIAKALGVRVDDEMSGFALTAAILDAINQLKYSAGYDDPSRND